MLRLLLIIDKICLVFFIPKYLKKTKKEIKTNKKNLMSIMFIFDPIGKLLTHVIIITSATINTINSE